MPKCPIRVRKINGIIIIIMDGRGDSIAFISFSPNADIFIDRCPLNARAITRRCSEDTEMLLF